jgi:signal transduction histidine kinase
MNPFFAVHIVVCALCGILQATSLLAQTPEADSLKRALALEARTLKDTALIDRLNQIAYSVRNNIHDTALHYANEALARSLRIQYKRGQARAQMIIGIVAIYEGHFSVALEAHLQAIDLYSELGETTMVAYLLNNIGYLHKAQKKLDIAQDYFSRAETLFRQTSDTIGLTLVLGNLGDVALQSGEYAKALALEREAVECGRDIRDRYYFNVALFHLGAVFFALERYDSARYYQERALRNFESEGTVQYVVRSLENLSAIYAAEKRYSEAFATAERGLAIADSVRAAVDIALMCDRLSLLHAERGDYDKAFAYFRRTATLRDSLTALNIEERMKNLALIQNAEKARQELALAEKEQERAATLLTSLVLGLFLLTALLALAVNRYRIKARSEEELRKFNALILEQGKQLERQAERIQETNAELTATNEELDANNERLREANIRLEAANERLSALNHEKDEFLGIAAHDLKNPLTGIFLSASALQAGGAQLSQERVATLADRIVQSSERMLSAINKLLNLNVLEQGGARLEITRFDLVALARELCAEQEERALAKNIRLTFETFQQECFVETDESAVAEILENLIDNALKYSPLGSSVRVEVQRAPALAQAATTGKADDDDDDAAPLFARILVQDEGPGFTDDDKQRLFGKFARLSAKPTAGESSTGLGLSIVKKLADAIGASVRVESSSVAGGARFIVEIAACSEEKIMRR